MCNVVRFFIKTGINNKCCLIAAFIACLLFMLLFINIKKIYCRIL
ncbi:hypothetical protein A1OE_55 [Candidatus Endolissoclinum faulkneri L2]|uniref:Uncharacterized protein n=1 Tax=Candidatus Endolissoclinum faulkneri L2 TaxID=1193729 RepID=K7YNR9_9PROT|nr:hypothetical protein A1OE_55 [Candidatus Endolissoclinum faulkneri L2]